MSTTTIKCLEKSFLSLWMVWYVYYNYKMSRMESSTFRFPSLGAVDLLSFGVQLHLKGVHESGVADLTVCYLKILEQFRLRLVVSFVLL